MNEKELLEKLIQLSTTKTTSITKSEEFIKLFIKEEIKKHEKRNQ